MGWASQSADGALLSVRVIPRASRNEVQGVLGDALKIRLQAPPVEQAANRALLDFLAGQLGIRAGQLELIGGATSRNKRVRVRGLAAAEVQARLTGSRGPAR